MPLVPAPVWTDEQLEADRQAAIGIFRQERMEEALEPYSDAFESARQAVATLIEMTVDLTRFDELAVDIVCDADLYTALRYVAGPPISHDDLKTLADVNTDSVNVHRANPHYGAAMVETVMLGHDRGRFPWIGEDRDPTEAERTTAIISTAALMAQRKVMTARANESKDLQEQATAQALVAAGFTGVAPRNIPTIQQAPAPGQFCHESLVAGRKADLVVRLWDGRLMPIECKVSNSSLNSVKRLNNDAAVKAGHWLAQMGAAQTVPVAVIGGVFNLVNLRAAQDAGLRLFWAHDFQKMIDFINATK
ncbi:MAG TPA: XamI family restriction endonuclease [Acidimicrobiales bacterium]|nr:XamI family restriction endonuclease [Acidimicrobiales bacterium]